MLAFAVEHSPAFHIFAFAQNHPSKFKGYVRPGEDPVPWATPANLLVFLDSSLS